ncbi:MerR family transcriptional regulator (plasmid) [Cytobacillus firmus]|nr:MULTISPECIES: MerR family transcriptional regulator [Bacillaceae]MBN8202550.1 MerR family transcriptional regulator [Bacillus sp. NTK034]
MEVEFITLGDAADRLGVPASTLRNWTDQLEQFEVHYVKRNNRNERIYYDDDLQIFKFIQDLKDEHGRRTTMKDIAAMLKDMRERFNLRDEEDAPVPKPSNKTGDLLNADDVQRLLDNQRVRTLFSYMIGETTKQIRNDLVEEFQQQLATEREILKETLREEVRKELLDNQSIVETKLQGLQDEQEKRDKELTEELKRRDAESLKLLRELMEQRKKEAEEQKNKGFFSRLFGG